VTELDRASLDRILPAALGPADWDDVLSRSGARQRRHRLAVVLVAATLVAVGAAAASGTVRNLIFGTASVPGFSPGWSPDGSRIAYVVNRGGRDDLYVINADGTAKRRLRRNANSPAWSPDGRTLAFVGRHGDVDRGYDGSDIYVANAGVGGLRKLPHTAWAGDPVWSRDGRQIAFNSGLTLGGIYLMNADGSGGRRVVAAGDPPIGRFDWSPDGQSIAFEQADGPHYPRIYVMGADGSGRRWLADGTRPLWSPRGGVIAFVAYRSDELWRINADGSGRRKLTGTAGVSAVNGAQGYAWSPDGRKIVFTVGDWMSGDTEIYVMNADGSGQRNLTRHPGPDDYAAWSPDGRKIAFVRNREIYVMNADGSGQRRLTP
jgi:TolB protein